MEIVRPGFRPVLPRMRTGVSCQMAVLPRGGRAVVVVMIEGCCVVRAFVTEQAPELVEANGQKAYAILLNQ